MRIALLLSGLLAGGSAATASAAEPLEQVKVQLESNEFVRGQFKQDKQLTGFTKSLQSGGSFLLWRDHGVIWNTTSPFASNVAITPSAVRISNGGKPYTVQSDAKREPALRVVNEIVFAVLAGDVTRLAQRFDIETKLHDGAWTLHLKPRDAAVRRAFSAIDVDGDRLVRGVQIQESSGDRTAIRFEAMTSGAAAAATTDETRLLAK